ncbi:MAG TPA: hypothetical protein VFH94_25540, partial [Streptomyces sp.]|nr:hypothetical protein [Streptomyces sp.]
LLPLAVLAARVWHGVPADSGSAEDSAALGEAAHHAAARDAVTDGAAEDSSRWGPYEPWARPHLLLARGADAEAAAAVRRIPDPPPGLLAEVLWILAGRAAIAVDDRRVAERARAALTPAAGEVSAGSGVLTAGPIRDHLAALTNFLAS